MSKDILHADAHLRRTTWLVLGAAAVLCLIVLVAFSRWLAGIGDMPVADLAHRVQRLIALALTGCALCFATLAWLAARAGRRTIESGQWPAPEARVIRDTEVRRGDAARRIGRQFLAAAVVLLVFAIGAGVISVRMLGH